MHTPLLRFAGLVTGFNRAVFHGVAWLVLGMVALYFAVAVLRYFFGWGSVAMQESVIYLHATLFMLAIAAGLANDTHVRVDIFYGALNARRKALVDGLGSLVLVLPVGLFLLWSCWDYVAASWAQGETSTDAGGLPWIYVLKTLIPVFAVQLILQALANAITHFHRFRTGG